MGKANVTEENLQEFLINAKELEIKGLEIKDPLDCLETKYECITEESLEPKDSQKQEPSNENSFEKSDGNIIAKNAIQGLLKDVI